MKFLKYLLIFILIVILIVVLTIVSWWKDWPLFSGLVIVGGIFALILLVYGIKKLWQFKNKRQFISSIFNQQEKLNKENEVNQNINLSNSANEINATWKAGMQYFQKSNLRFNRRPELAQPWYLVLDDRHLNNAKNISIFNSFGNNLKENSLLSWHFLNSAILLHTGLLDESEDDNNAWNELLTLISSQGKSALKGVIFSIDIQSLQDMKVADNNNSNTVQNFAKLSKIMRERLNTLMLAINQNIPVYYICNGLEIIDGFNDWLDRLPTEILDEVYLGMLNENNFMQQYFHEKSFKFSSKNKNNNNGNNNFNTNTINNYNLFTADNLIYQLQNFIREVIDKNALEGIPPRGDDLMLIIKLNTIIENLFVLFNSTFLENPHLINPNLRGAFFCASSGKDYLKNGKVAFLNAIINNLLNSERALHLNKDLHTKFSLKATTKTICYLSFLGILFTFCGFVSIYTIYQNKVLNRLQTYQYSKYSSQYDHHSLQNSHSSTNWQNKNVDEMYDKLNKDLREILFLENASNNWWLPKFGVNILDRIIDIKREKFILQAMDFVVNPILKLNNDFKYTTNDVQQDLNINVAEVERIDKMVVLEWLTDKIYSIKAGDLTLNNYLYHSNTEVFPINSSLEKIWNPLTDDIIVATLYWGHQEDNLHNLNIISNIRKNLSIQFSRITEDSNKNKLTAMQPVLDLLGQRLNATDICLSNFWMHIVPKSQNDFCIPSIYTAKVANYLEELKGEMFDILEYNSNDDEKEKNDLKSLIFKNFKRGYDKNKLQQESKNSLNTYYNNYVKSWYEFVLKFSDTLKDANDKEIFVRHTNFKNINDIPYLKLLRKMNEETIVLKNMSHPPSWLSGIGKLNILLDILTNLDDNIKDGNLSVLFNIAYTTPNSLKALRSATSSNEEMFQLIKSLPQLRIFFDDIRKLSSSLQSSEQALKIVTMFYSGTGIIEENTQQNTDNTIQNTKNSTNNIASIYKDAGNFVANISVQYSDKNDPQLVIFRDILNLLTTGLIIQAGNEIQHLWETEVLNSAVYRLHKDNADSMFGDNGIVQMFVAKHLKPFIVWRDGNPMPNVWENHTFPLTDNFLSMLRTGEQAVLNKPQDKYKISVYTQPTIVNVGAKALPNATKIVLECNDNQQEILNRNYPLARTFEYDTKLCSFVNISIIFPQFELQHKFESFGEFIAAFQEGEIILYADDFPNQSALLNEANINEIKVRILPDNTQSFIADQNMVAPNLPDKITYTW